jgi:N-acetylglucosaminyl-diphospho-decaprenol L-rhamnosyltransferase
MEDTMKLSIVIISWNTKALLVDCLDSVYQFPPKEEFEVWVVDNDSHDGSPEILKENYPQVHLIENKNNVGFAEANNQAIQYCQGKYILLLNPDTVVHANALESLVKFLDENEDAGAAGSYLLNPDGSLQPSCHPAPTLMREWWRLFHLDRFRLFGSYDMHSWDSNHPRRVDVIQGASFIVRKEIVDKIGFLDGDYFMFSEEVDLCYRLRNAGWEIYWVPQSQVVHYGGQSTRQVASEMFLQLYLGKLKYFRKHYGKGAGVAYKLILLMAAFFRIILTPLAWFEKSENRERLLRLSNHYFLLLRSLPSM